MDIESIQLILTQLDKIAEKLGVTAGAVWPWLMTRTYFMAWMPIILSVVFGIAALVMYKPHIKSLAEYKGKDDFGPITGCFWVSIAAFAICVMLIFIISLTFFINPEYHALQSLIEMIK